MATGQQPDTLRLSRRAAKQRKTVEFELADDRLESCEIKLPTEIGLADYEEIQRVMDAWEKLGNATDEDKRLATIIRLVRRMIDIFFFDKPSKEAIDNLNWEQMEELGAFLEEHYTALTPTTTLRRARQAVGKGSQ